MTNAPFSAPTGLVLSAGGERVVAWQVGVLAGLADAGLDPSRATRIVGTSAGALVAARLAGGRDPRDDADRLAGTVVASPPAPPVVAAAIAQLMGAWQAGGDTAERRRRVGAAALAPTPGDGERRVEEVARELPGGAWPQPLRIVAVDAHTGARVVLGPADRVPLARAVAASRAIPLLREPIRVAGRHCIDGALGSATNADLAAAVDSGQVVILDPNGADNPLERLWAAALASEVAALRERDVHVEVIHAGSADRAAMGAQMMSGAGASAAVRAGRAAGRAWAERLAGVAPA